MTICDCCKEPGAKSRTLSFESQGNELFVLQPKADLCQDCFDAAIAKVSKAWTLFSQAISIPKT